MASERTTAALEELRASMIEDEGQDEGTVDALLHAVQPKTTNLTGNYADLQRLGGLVASGESSGGAAVDQAVGLPDSPAPDAAEAGDYASMTKAELQAELDSRGIEYSQADTKADLLAALEG